MGFVSSASLKPDPINMKIKGIRIIESSVRNDKWEQHCLSEEYQCAKDLSWSVSNA